MQQDWLIKSLKFIKLNLSFIVLGFGFLVVLVWAGVRFSQSFETAVLEEYSEKTEVAEVLEDTPTPTVEPSPTPEVTPTPVVTPTPTPIPTSTPTPMVTPTPQPSITPLPTATPEVIVSPKATPAPTVKPFVASPTIVPTPMEQRQVTTEESTPSMQAKTYVVQPGDSTWKVAEKLLGDGRLYTAIERASKLKHNQHLAIGQILTIPAQETVQQLPDRSKITSGVSITIDGQQEVVPTGKTYTVQPGDCLWNIAERELGSPFAWVELYALNKSTIGSNPDLIYPNTVLQLPVR